MIRFSRPASSRSNAKRGFGGAFVIVPFTFHLRSLAILNLAVTLMGEAHADDSLRNQAPPPELKRLSATIGIWDTKSLYRFTPDAPPFEGQSVETVRWSANQQFVISDQRGLMPDGWKNKLVITMWNPVKNEYRLVDLSSTGETVELTMRIEGGVRKILYYRPFEGRFIRSELTLENLSDVEIKFRCECTDGERTWTFSEGISKKRKLENRDTPEFPRRSRRPSPH